MATIVREVLNNNGMAAQIVAPPGGLVGVNLGGTWTGTVSFFGSFDGVNFVPVSLTPYPTGTPVQSATANGKFSSSGANFQAFKVVFTLTSGSVLATLAIAQDSSWQDAFLAATSKYVNSEATGGAANTLTQAAVANQAWRLRSLSVAFSVAPANPVKVTITDGASSTLWSGYVPKDTPAGGTFLIPLPPPDPAIPNSGGVVNTPGNSLVIALAAPSGGIVSELNGEFLAA